MSKTPLEKKLRLLDEGPVLVLNTPQPYEAFFNIFPEYVPAVDQSSEEIGFVHLLISNMAELDQFLDLAMNAVVHDGLLWISYP